jgi:hypothetical protein
VAGLAAGAVADRAVPAPPAVGSVGYGTSPFAAQAADNYADLLPPVRYQRGQPAGALSSGGADGAGTVQPWSQPASPAQPRPGSVSPGTAGTSRARSGRPALVFATVVGAAALAVLLPVAGTIAALGGLALLRCADLSGTWLSRRRSRQGPRAADPVTVLAYLPVAAFRAVLGLLLMLPLGLLVAAAAATATYVVLPGHPVDRAASYAAGALIACCALAPGSTRSRRPLSTFFGAITTTGPSVVLVSVAVIALAAGLVGAALSYPALFWPLSHLSLSLHLPFGHGLLGHTIHVSRLAKRLRVWAFG